MYVFQFAAVCLKPEMTASSFEAEKKANADMCVRAENWAKQRAELEIWDSNLKRKIIHFTEFLHKDYKSEDNDFVRYHLCLFQAQVEAHALLQRCFPLSYEKWQKE